MAEMMRMQFDLYKFETNKSFEEDPNFYLDLVFPCEIVDIFESVEGKVGNSLKESVIFMELEFLLASVADSVKLLPLTQEE